MKYLCTETTDIDLQTIKITAEDNLVLYNFWLFRALLCPFLRLVIVDSQLFPRVMCIDLSLI